MSEQRPKQRWLAVIEFDADGEKGAWFALESGQAGSGIKEKIHLTEISRDSAAYVLEVEDSS